MNAVVFQRDDWVERARGIPLLEIAERAGAKLKPAGAERIGPCPSCGGTDRFAINARDNVWNCRGAEGGNSPIDLAMHILGCDFMDAVEFITGEPRPNTVRETSEAERAAAAQARAKREADRERREAQRARLEAAKLVRDGEAVASILERAEPFPGSPAENYLIARGAGLPRALARDLRFVDGLDYWGQSDATTESFELVATLPAMVAIIRAVSGGIVGLHVTYLDPNAPRKWVAPWEASLPKKARRNPAKKFRKTVEKLNGAMIRLGAIGETLVLGEGIETVGAYLNRLLAPEDASFGVAMSLQNLAGGAVAQVNHPGRAKGAGVPNTIADPEKPGVILPPQVKRVILLGDRDSDYHATRAALATAASRYIAQGREVWVDVAPEGEDFASMAKEIDAAAATSSVAEP